MSIRLRTFVFVLILFAVVLFAAANWPLFVQMTPINLLVVSVLAPFGIVMLAILGGVTLFYILLLAKMETESLVGSRRYNKELEDARKLALSAEESRIASLQEEMERGISTLDQKVDEILRRVDEQGRVRVRQDAPLSPETPVMGDET